MNQWARCGASLGGAFMTAAFLMAVLPQPAHAYLDANTGSMILQALLAGVGGILMLIKMHWKRWFGRKRPSPPKG
ncbi:MAG: hypothetical protein IPP35_01885 [Elusimicrobia bacterium]|nr:hypothetical protein [Elusimicrobiota bacterium]